MAMCFSARPVSGLNVLSHCSQVLLVNMNPITANANAKRK